MANPAANKRRGAQFELDLLSYLRSRGVQAERLRLSGREDEGDLSIKYPGDADVIIEAKAPGRGQPTNLTGWTAEAEREALNYALRRRMPHTEATPAVVIKAAGGSIEDAHVVIPLKRFIEEYL